MPTYTVTDPTSGKTLRLTGDSPPTEVELNNIFSIKAQPEPTFGQRIKSAVNEGLVKPIKTLAGGFETAAADTAKTVDFYAKEFGTAFGIPENKNAVSKIAKVLSGNWQYFGDKLKKEGLSEGLAKEVYTGLGKAGFDVPVIMAGAPVLKAATLPLSGAVKGYEQGGAKGAAQGAVEGALFHKVLGALNILPSAVRPVAGAATFGLTTPGGVKEKVAGAALGGALSVGGPKVSTEQFKATMREVPETLAEQPIGLSVKDVSGKDFKRPEEKPKVSTPQLSEIKAGISTRVDFQDRVTAAQDLSVSAKEQKYKIPVNPDGSITVYHGTSAENAQKINTSGNIESQAFFSPNKSGAEFYGKTKNKAGEILPIKVDARDIEYSTGTGEIYTPNGLTRDKDGIWKSPDRITPPTEPLAGKVEAVKPPEPTITPAVVSETVQPDILTADAQRWAETPAGRIIKAMRPPSVETLGLKAKETPITSTEEQLLRNKLRTEARGAKEGFATGKKETRTKLLDQLQQQQADISGVKKEVVRYAKENLPSKETRFISMAANAKNQRDLVTAFSRIDRIAEQGQRKAIIGEIKTGVSEAVDSPGVAVDYKQRIKGVAAAVELKGHSPETIRTISQTKQYIEKQKALGKDVEMPERIIKRLEILNRIPAEALTTGKLESIRDEINLLTQLGKVKWATKQRLYEAERDIKKKELLSSTVNLDKNPEIQTTPEGTLSFTEKGKNFIRRRLAGAQRVNLAITPIDVVMDIADGGKGTYAGGHSKIKRNFDINYSEYLNEKDGIQKPIIDLGKNLGLNEKNYKRIGVYAAKMQEGGTEKLLNSGYTQAEIDSIRITPSELKMYEKMRTSLDELLPGITDVMRNVYNQEVNQVKNYFSFMTDWKAMDEAEVFQRVGNQAEEFGHPTKNAELGFTKTRTGPGQQKIDVNALDVFLRHTDNAVYLTNMARDLRQTSEIFNSPEYKQAAGARGQMTMLNWIDTMSRKGGSAGQKQIQILDTLRKNSAVGVLGLKLTSMLVQPTSLMDGATFIGHYAFKGASNMADPQWRQFVMKFPEIRTRVGDDPAFMDITAKAGKVGMAGLTFFDKMTAMSVAAGAYEKKMGEMGKTVDFNDINQEAMQYAQLVVRRTQASSVFKDSPQALTRGLLTSNRSVDRAVLQFQTFMLNRWSLLKHDAFKAGIIEKNPAQAIRIFTWLAVATLMETGIRYGYQKALNLATGAEDKKDTPFINQYAQQAAGNVPFAGSLISAMTYSSYPVPIIEGTAKPLGEAGMALFGSKKPATRLKHAMFAATGVGKLSGIPGISQGEQILRRVMQPKGKEKKAGGGFYSSGSSGQGSKTTRFYSSME